MFTRSDLEQNAAPRQKGTFLKELYAMQGGDDVMGRGRRRLALHVTKYDHVPALEENYLTEKPVEDREPSNSGE